MTYSVIDQDSIAPRPCAASSMPAAPRFPVNVVEGVLAGYGQLVTDAVPYAYSGPAMAGGTKADYRVVGGGLEGHTASAAPQAFPLNPGGGSYQSRPVWDGNYNPSQPSSASSRTSDAVLYQPSAATLVNGSTSPATVFTGDSLGVSVVFTFPSWQLAPSPSHAEVASLSVVSPSHVATPLGTFPLLATADPAIYTLAVAAYTAGSAPFVQSGKWTFQASYAGDQINAPTLSNAVVVTLSLP